MTESWPRLPRPHMTLAYHAPLLDWNRDQRKKAAVTCFASDFSGMPRNVILVGASSFDGVGKGDASTAAYGRRGVTGAAAIAYLCLQRRRSTHGATALQNSTLQLIYANRLRSL